MVLNLQSGGGLTIIAEVRFSSTSTPRNFFALVLSSTPRLSSSTTRDTAISAGSASLPVYNSTGGPTGNGHVSFDSAQQHFLDGGGRLFNAMSNGVFTVVAVVRFTGLTTDRESLISFGTGANKRAFSLGRTFANHSGLVVNNLFMTLHDTDSVNTSYHTPGSIPYQIVEQEWITIVGRYCTMNNTLDLMVNNLSVASAILPASWLNSVEVELNGDMNLSYTLVGGDRSAGHGFLHADVAGLFVVDEYLSTEAGLRIADAMKQGEDLTSLFSAGTDVTANRLESVIELESEVCCPGSSGSNCAVCTSDRIILARTGNERGIRLQVYENDTIVCEATATSVLVMDTWMTLVARYDAVANSVDILKDGQQVALAICTAIPSDRSVSRGYIGLGLRLAWKNESVPLSSALPLSTGEALLDAYVAAYVAIQPAGFSNDLRSFALVVEALDNLTLSALLDSFGNSVLSNADVEMPYAHTCKPCGMGYFKVCHAV